MAKSAYIKLMKGSGQNEITLEEVKRLFLYYQEITSLTGQQLGWDYQAAAFPYTVEEREQDGITYLYLRGNNPHEYHGLVVGVGQEEATGHPYIQIVLGDQATHGDHAKANEFCKFFAKKLKGELHLFNRRVIYYNDRK